VFLLRITLGGTGPACAVLRLLASASASNCGVRVLWQGPAAVPWSELAEAGGCARTSSLWPVAALALCRGGIGCIVDNPCSPTPPPCLPLLVSPFLSFPPSPFQPPATPHDTSPSHPRLCAPSPRPQTTSRVGATECTIPSVDRLVGRFNRERTFECSNCTSRPTPENRFSEHA
jgi:hypothetical protein